jgi:hypothetical protein
MLVESSTVTLVSTALLLAAAYAWLPDRSNNTRQVVNVAIRCMGSLSEKKREGKIHDVRHARL